MGEKKTNQIGISTIFLIFAIIVIVIMGYFVYKFYTEKTFSNKEIERLNNQLNQLEGQINTIKENINTSTNDTDSDNQKDNNNKVGTNDKMTLELAYGILNKYKNEELPDAKWFITNVKLIAHGNNNTYWVSYEDYNLDGNYTESAGTIIEYKNGEWTTELPGFSGISDEKISEYNFVNY